LKYKWARITNARVYSYPIQRYSDLDPGSAAGGEGVTICGAEQKAINITGRGIGGRLDTVLGVLEF
jgi:hypothetical protein